MKSRQDIYFAEMLIHLTAKFVVKWDIWDFYNVMPDVVAETSLCCCQCAGCAKNYNIMGQPRKHI